MRSTPDNRRIFRLRLTLLGMSKKVFHSVFAHEFCGKRSVQKGYKVVDRFDVIFEFFQIFFGFGFFVRSPDGFKPFFGGGFRLLAGIVSRRMHFVNRDL